MFVLRASQGNADNILFYLIEVEPVVNLASQLVAETVFFMFQSFIWYIIMKSLGRMLISQRLNVCT